MTGPSISEQREAVERSAADCMNLTKAASLSRDTRLKWKARGEIFRAAAETLAVVEWMQRTSPHGWAREVTLYKRAQAELAAMGGDRKEGRGDD